VILCLQCMSLVVGLNIVNFINSCLNVSKETRYSQCNVWPMGGGIVERVESDCICTP
jgi:hypothetical protein